MNKIQHLEQANVVENDEKCHDKEKCFCNNYVAKNSYLKEDYVTRRDDCINTEEKYVEILSFTHFSKFFRFDRTGEIGRKKSVCHEIHISVGVELV